MPVVQGGYQTFSVAISATNNALIAGTAGQRIYVTSYSLAVTGTPTGVQFTDAGTALEGPNPTAFRAEACGAGQWLFRTSAGNGLGITITAGTSPTVNGRITYYVAP